MRYQINLFPPKELNFVDKVIYFSFNYLRYILVITQLVVISVFFYRFKIDQEIVDLKDSLKQKEEIVLVSNSLLRDVRSIDVKVKQTATVLSQQTELQDMMNYFLSRFPADLNLTKLTVGGGTIKFEGYTLRPDLVRVFYNQMKQDKRFKLVSLDALRKNESVGFQFIFTLGNYVTQK